MSQQDVEIVKRAMHAAQECRQLDDEHALLHNRGHARTSGMDL
jgi:hypothetical protein